MSKSEKKAAPEKKSEAEVIEKAVELFPVPSAEVSISQDRTKLIPLPAMFFMESDPAKVAKPKGHQIDPSRPEGYVAVMPSISRLAEEGNPYPVSILDPAVVTADRWRPLVEVAHAVWIDLTERGEFGASDLPKGAKEDVTNRMAVRDTLRDLSLFGLCRPVWMGRKKVYRIA